MEEQKTNSSVGLAVVFLMFMSLYIEFITGNTPLSIIFTPQGILFAVIIQGLHYGLGANLIREMTSRWNKGLPSVLLLGAVYGMFNEAIDTKGFFDPQFYSVVAMGLVGFGRWGDINVIWALGLTMVHAVLSITVPITLTDALFPGTRGRLGKKTLAIMLLVFSVIVFLMTHINKYQVGWPEWLLIVALMISLTLTARFLPPFSLSMRTALPRDWALFISGAVGTVGFFLTFNAFHKFIPNPVLNIVAVICLLAFYSWLLLRLPDLSMRSKVALATGIYTVPTVAGLVSGNIVQAVISIGILIAASRRAKRETVAVVIESSLSGERSKPSN